MIRLLLALVLILASCVPADSGIEGWITAGPSCPVERQGQPCPDHPYAGTLTILREPGRTAVASVTADQDGYYRIALSPGNYMIHPESPAVLPRAAEVSVSVRAHGFTRQDIVYDTGVR